MKNNVLKMAALLLVTLMGALVACTPNDARQGTQSGDQAQQVAAETNGQSTAQAPVGDIQPTITGEISHDTWNEGQRSTVSFVRFPASLAEWEQARKVLGGEPQGAVALQVMAFELFRRDAEAGKQALEMNNTGVNFTQTLRQLQQIMDVKDTYYARPYLAAALLKGATPDNGYHPDEPYQLEVRVNPVSKYQESEMVGGTVIYLQVDSKGWDTNWRGVEVVKPEGQQYYVVSNCPALYTQCKKVKGQCAEVK